MPNYQIQCECCNIQFVTIYRNQRFCSRRCSNTAVPRRQSTKVLVKCRFSGCENIVSHYTNHFCRCCIQLGRHKMSKWDGALIDTLTVGDYTKREGANKYDSIRARARSAIRNSNRPMVCEDCGWDKHVEVCHIKPICSFEPNTKISVVNDLSNLRLLCPNCHWVFDHPNR